LRTRTSGATLLVVGVLLGALINSVARADAGAGSPRSAVVVHTSIATLPPGAFTTGAPKPSATATATPSPPATSVPVPTFNPQLPVTVGFGDSITYRPNSYFRQVCDDGVVVENCLNAGIPGNTTSQMLARMDTDVLSYKPAIVIVMGGTNDLKHRVRTATIVRHLDTIIDQAREAGAVTVLCTVPPRDHYGNRVLALNKAIRKYAAKNKVPLLDFYSQLGNRKGEYKSGMSVDGTHPSRRGADRMTALAEAQLPGLLHPVRRSPLYSR
jgi:lysophospholipase L1-like esterase